MMPSGHIRACGHRSTHINLSTRWWWVVSFTYKLLYNCRKNSQQPSGRRLSTSQSCFGDYKEKKNLCPCLELTPISQSSNLLPHWQSNATHTHNGRRKKKTQGHNNNNTLTIWGNEWFFIAWNCQLSEIISDTHSILVSIAYSVHM